MWTEGHIVLSCCQLCTWLSQQASSLILALFLFLTQTHYCWFLTTNNLSICYKSLQYVYIVVLLVQNKYFCIILSHVCWGSFSKGMNFVMQLLRIFRSENLNWVLRYFSEKQENHKSKIVQLCFSHWIQCWDGDLQESEISSLGLRRTDKYKVIDFLKSINFL